MSAGPSGPAPAGPGKNARELLVTTRLSVQQVHGDRLGRCAGIAEDARRIGVQPGARAR